MYKRITLLLTSYDGVFTKTRNFNPEHIYSIEHIDYSFFDEIIIVGIDNLLSSKYIDFIKSISSKLSIPLVVSGGINSFKDAKKFFDLGADRIILNRSLWSNPSIIKEISNVYGKQAVIASIDFIDAEDGIYAYDWRLKEKRNTLLPNDIQEIVPYIGEILLQDVSRDGKVIGANIKKINQIINDISLNVPFQIGSCGIVSWSQYVELLKQDKIDAVAIANIHHMSDKANKSLRELCIIENLNIRTPWKFVKSA